MIRRPSNRQPAKAAQPPVKWTSVRNQWKARSPGFPIKYPYAHAFLAEHGLWHPQSLALSSRWIAYIASPRHSNVNTVCVSGRWHSMACTKRRLEIMVGKPPMKTSIAWAYQTTKFQEWKLGNCQKSMFHTCVSFFWTFWIQCLKNMRTMKGRGALCGLKLPTLLPHQLRYDVVLVRQRVGRELRTVHLTPVNHHHHHHHDDDEDDDHHHQELST